MSNKPNLVQVLDILRMKDEATALYKQIDARIVEMLSEFGAGRFDYDLEELLDEWNPDNGYPFDKSLMDDGRYLKFVLEDNIQKLKDGEAVWRSVATKPVTFSSMNLKRVPDSLK